MFILPQINDVFGCRNMAPVKFKTFFWRSSPQDIMKSGPGLELRNFAQFSSNSPLALWSGSSYSGGSGFCRFAKCEKFCIASLLCLPVRLADVFQKMKYQMQNVKSFASLAFPPSWSGWSIQLFQRDCRIWRKWIGHWESGKCFDESHESLSFVQNSTKKKLKLYLVEAKTLVL